jgi:hypothetical protein
MPRFLSAGLTASAGGRSHVALPSMADSARRVPNTESGMTYIQNAHVSWNKFSPDGYWSHDDKMPQATVTKAGEVWRSRRGGTSSRSGVLPSSIAGATGNGPGAAAGRSGTRSVMQSSCSPSCTPPPPSSHSSWTASIRRRTTSSSACVLWATRCTFPAASSSLSLTTCADPQPRRPDVAAR